ncbi:hypothetical protein BASA81_012734 [Batrachochytrium salamandrivorans]|nr:hypothetical protein BASA81_012734 [Batrachochytrium salamandrivorans]
MQQALECPCCFEVMQKPVLFASCGHSFCSLCIRRFLQQQQRNNSSKHCPVCNSPQPEGEAGLVTCVALTNLALACSFPDQPQPPQPQRIQTIPIAKLPALVYHLLGEDKLDEALVGCNLPHGPQVSKDRKIALHREYTLQVNNLVASGDVQTDPVQLRKSVLDACANFSKPTARNPFASSTPMSSSSLAKVTRATVDKFPREHRQHRKLARKQWKPALVSGNWRAVFSDSLNKPVYYNQDNNECTTQRPPDLFPIQQDGEGTIVVVQVDDEGDL